MENYEEQSTEGVDVRRYLQVLRQRHVPFLISLLVGWVIVWGASWVMPVRYKSGTLILVEQPTMPKNYVVPNISDDLQSRLQSITQQILSRTRLLLIIDKLDLYGENRRLLAPDEKVELMRRDIDIELVRNTPGDQISAFRISYSARDPQIAQEVTSQLTNLFISENLKVRQQQSEDTTRFLSSQLESARANLVDQEAKIRGFKGQHEGELPSQEASNLQILNGLQEQLQNEQDTLNAAKQQRVYLETLIEQYRSVHTPPQSMDGTPTTLGVVERQLTDLRSRLADLSSRYTERYPEIEKLKDEIARTEEVRNTLLAEAKNKENGSQANNTAPNATDPSQGSTSLQFQSQLQANEIEIANREKSIADLKTRVNSYQDRLNNEPAQEQELADLTRGYDQSKANYDDLLKKQNESEMATNMEQMQQGQRFTMLDPPSLPLKPDFPNRVRFSEVGLGAGLVLGILVVCGLEFLDDRIHEEKQIRALLSTAVISEIPEVVSWLDEQKIKRRTRLGWVMAVAVAVLILAGSALSYLHA